MKFVLKKKIVLKTKINLHFVNKKTSKGKKKNEKKWNEQKYCTAKKNRIKKFETQNLRRGTVTLLLVKDTEIMNKEEDKM